MRKLLIIPILLVQSVFALNVKTIKDIEQYKGTADQIFVTDFKEGGVFYPYGGSRKEDGGVIIKDGSGRLWQRHYDVSNGVNPWWWQAKGDGVNDDLTAFNKMAAYVTMNGTFGQNGGEEFSRPKIFIPDGIFRITGQWKVVGGSPVNGTDAVLYQCGPSYHAPSFKINEWIKSGSSLPVNIECSGRAFIWGDFKATELTAIVSYSALAYAYGGVSEQTASIKGLNILGRHKQDHNFIGDDTKQIGLLVMGSKRISFENCSFYGLQYGMVHNMAYFSTISQNFFGNCGTGFFTMGSHSSTGMMLSADHCNLGFEFISGACSWTQVSGEQCKRAMQVAGNNTIFNGGYLEQLDKTSGNNDFQVHVGYPAGHPFNKQSRVTGITFNNLLIVGKNAVLIDNGVLDVTFSGATASGRNVNKNPSAKVFSGGIEFSTKTQ